MPKGHRSVGNQSVRFRIPVWDDINGGWGFGKSDWTVPGFSTGNFNVNGGLVGGTLG